MANLPIALVEVAGITKLEDLHNLRQRSFFNRHKEVSVLCEAPDYVKLRVWTSADDRFPPVHTDGMAKEIVLRFDWINKRQ